MPLSAVLSAGRRVREHADALAELFVGVMRSHSTEAEPTQLRPLARAVVDAELSMAFDRRLRRDDGTGPKPSETNTPET